MDAALAGAVMQPQLALAIVRALLKYDPNDAAYAAPALVTALNKAGRFQTALEFIKDAPADSREDWTKATFQCWGMSQPQDAIQALDSIADEKLRNEALQTLMEGWSVSEPAALANFATSLPAGSDQAYMLDKAIDCWSVQDPAAMADWLNTSPPGVPFDQAAAALISKIDSVNGSPEVAMHGWEKFPIRIPNTIP